MSDLEELLRADLHDAADTMPADLDVNALVQRGRRLRATRTRQRGLAVLAAAVVVGVAGWAGLTQRGTNGVPDPASTPSVTDAASSVTFETEPGSVPRSPYALLTAKESDGVLTLTGRQRESDAGVRLASVPVSRTAATGTAISPRLSLWQVPGRIDWVDAHPRGTSVGPYLARPGFLSSSGVTVVIVVAQQDQRSKDWVEGLIWRASDGSLRSSAGTNVSTAVVALSDTSLTVYRDPGLKVVSFFDALAGRGFTSIRDTPAHNVVKIQVVRKSSTGGWEQFAVGILPPGARDPRVTVAVPGAEVATGTMRPDGAVTFVARNRTDTEPRNGLISKVTYTDATGQTRTYRP
ncbi:MAG: hypothetical protein QM695_13155 [Micropruina sp.]